MGVSLQDTGIITMFVDDLCRYQGVLHRRHGIRAGLDDVDAAAAQLAGRGMKFLNGPMNRWWGIRTVSFADPSGHIWELAGPIPNDAAAAE